MACIVIYKGRKFFKEDFIDMVLDTMRLTDEEIAGSEYLKKIKYENVFKIGDNDPIGIRAADANGPVTNEKVNQKGREEGLLTEPTAEQKTEPVSSLSEPLKPEAENIQPQGETIKPQNIKDNGTIQEQSPESLLPRQQGEVGKSGGQPEGVGQVKQGNETAKKGEKVEGKVQALWTKLSKGKTASDKARESKSEFRDESEFERFVSEESENPAELAESYIRHAIKDPVSKKDYKSDIIDEYGAAMTTQDFGHYGDPNSTSFGIAKKYFRKDAKPLDTTAQELSGIAGIEITPQDIIDHIYREQRSQGRYTPKETPIQVKLRDRYAELTDGRTLSLKEARDILEHDTNLQIKDYEKFIEQEFRTEADARAAFEQAIRNGEITIKDGEIIDTPQGGQGTPTGAKTPVEAAKERLRVAKENAAAIRKKNANLGAFKDVFEETRQQAMADREVLDAYVVTAREYIKEGVRSAEEFASKVGEELTDEIKSIWERATNEDKYGIKVGLVDDAIRDAMDSVLDRRDIPSVLSDARRKVAAGEINPQSLVQKILDSEAYSPVADEIAALVDYKVTLENKRSEISQKLDKAIADGDNTKVSQFREQLSATQSEIYDYDVMSLKTGADASKAFSLRKLMLNNEFNAAKAISDYKRNNKGEIPPDIEAKLKEMDGKFRELNDALLKNDAEKAELQQKLAESEILRQAAERKKTTTTTKEQPKSVLSPEKLARKQELSKKILGGFNDITQILANIASKEGREWMSLVFEESVGEFKAFSKELINTVGKEIIPHLKKLYKEAGGKDEGIFGANKPTWDKKKQRLKVSQGLLLDLVDSGITTIEGLTDAVKNLVKDEFPNLTDTQVRDAITNYGITTSPDQRPNMKALALAKRIGRLISSLELAQKAQRPFKSGLQREKPSQRERELGRQIRNFLKDIPETPEQQAKVWASALDKAKTALRNRKEDLQKAIDTNTKIVRDEKNTKVVDDELRQLEYERDQLQKQYDEIFKDPELTEAERVERAIAALEKASERVVTNIKAGKIEYAKKRSLPLTEALKRARERKALIDAVLNDMRKEEGLTLAREREMWKDRNVKAILKKRAENEKMRETGIAPDKKKKDPMQPFDEESQRIAMEKQKILDENERLQEIIRWNNRTRPQVWRNYFYEAIGVLPKALKLGFDLSWPFIQGLPYLGNKEWRAGYVKMFDFLKSEKNYNDYMDKVRSSPAYYDMVKKWGLYLAEDKNSIKAREEAYNSPLLHKIFKQAPIIKQTIGKAGLATERAFIGYGNFVRVETMKRYIKEMVDAGYSKEEIDMAGPGLANLINEATGRAKLPGKLDNIGNELAVIFTAPKYYTSVFNMTVKNPITTVLSYADLYKMDPYVRTKYIQTMTRMALMATSVAALIKMVNQVNPDIDIISDPTSNDFGRIKVGDKYYDGINKLFMWIILISQVTRGIKRNIPTGTETKVGGDNEGGITTGQLLGGWAEGRLSPGAAKVFYEMALNGGEDAAGHAVEWADVPRNQLSPLLIENTIEMYNDKGIRDAIINTPMAILGQGATVNDGRYEFTEADVDAELKRLDNKILEMRQPGYERKKERAKERKDKRDEAMERAMKRFGKLERYETKKERIKEASE